MEPELQYFNERKEKARQLYSSQKRVRNPFFQTEVIFNSDGFHHLQFSARRERDKREQLLKFSLLPLAVDIIKKSGTVQEYRKLLSPVGEPAARNGEIRMKIVQYWGLVAIVGKRQIKVKTVLRKVGDGNITFWSVMPYSKISRGKQKIFTEGIEDE